jgi:hypothetical protein
VATFQDARDIALALPAATERPSYGTPGFRVQDKLFVDRDELREPLTDAWRTRAPKRLLAELDG